MGIIETKIDARKEEGVKILITLKRREVDDVKAITCVIANSTAVATFVRMGLSRGFGHDAAKK